MVHQHDITSVYLLTHSFTYLLDTFRYRGKWVIKDCCQYRKWLRNNAISQLPYKIATKFQRLHPYFRSPPTRISCGYSPSDVLVKSKMTESSMVPPRLRDESMKDPCLVPPWVHDGSKMVHAQYSHGSAMERCIHAWYRHGSAIDPWWIHARSAYRYWYAGAMGVQWIHVRSLCIHAWYCDGSMIDPWLSLAWYCHGSVMDPWTATSSWWIHDGFILDPCMVPPCIPLCRCHGHAMDPCWIHGAATGHRCLNCIAMGPLWMPVIAMGPSLSMVDAWWIHGTAISPWWIHYSPLNPVIYRPALSHGLTGLQPRAPKAWWAHEVRK